MKDRTGATHQEILDAVYDREEREWATIKTLVNRTNNKILDAMSKLKISGPRLEFKTDLRAYRVTKNFQGVSALKPG
jgi:hypothetical protein